MAVIPWRDSGCEYRRRNLNHTIQHLQRGGIPVSTVDATRRKKFNVSAARNKGVTASNADIVLTIDADVIVPIAQLMEAASIAHRTGEVVTCYNKIAYLTDAGTTALIAGTIPNSTESHVERTATTPCGGANAVSKSTHATLGGWDESFTGWGHEDSEFIDRAAASIGHRFLRGNAYHQWHPMADKSGVASNHKRWMATRERIAATEPLSIVRRVRPGDNNEELRYSNRSLVNLPHRDLWIIGHKPSWLINANHIAGDRFATKWENIWDNVTIACQNSDISDPFILMDDDVFIMRPIREVPVMHRGRLADCVNPDDANPWKVSLGNTLEWCRANGIDDPLNYEVHTPYVIHKEQALGALEMARGWSWPLPPQARSVDGNLWQRGGIQIQDVKIRRRSRGGTDHGVFLSSEDRTFVQIRGLLHSNFPHPSQYEAPGVGTPGNAALEALRASRRRGTATQRARG